MSRLEDALSALSAARDAARRRDTFASRLAVAHAHEHASRVLVERAGWTCTPWGQAQLPERVREALKRTRCPARWAPDLIAINGEQWRWIDAKSEKRSGTPNFSIEKAALDAHIRWHLAHSDPHGGFIYVWDDFRCSYVGDLSDGVLRSGQFQGSGSGTPFWLVPKVATRPFHEVFGGPPVDGVVAA